MVEVVVVLIYQYIYIYFLYNLSRSTILEVVKVQQDIVLQQYSRMVVYQYMVVQQQSSKKKIYIYIVGCLGQQHIVVYGSIAQYSRVVQYQQPKYTLYTTMALYLLYCYNDYSATTILSCSCSRSNMVEQYTIVLCCYMILYIYMSLWQEQQEKQKQTFQQCQISILVRILPLCSCSSTFLLLLSASTFSCRRRTSSRSRSIYIYTSIYRGCSIY